MLNILEHNGNVFAHISVLGTNPCEVCSFRDFPGTAVCKEVELKCGPCKVDNLFPTKAMLPVSFATIYDPNVAYSANVGEVLSWIKDFLSLEQSSSATGGIFFKSKRWCGDYEFLVGFGFRGNSRSMSMQESPVITIKCRTSTGRIVLEITDSINPVVATQSFRNMIDLLIQ